MSEMSEWISCKERLPPVGELVEIRNSIWIEKVMRTHDDKWNYPSGLMHDWVQAKDVWRHAHDSTGSVYMEYKDSMADALVKIIKESSLSDTSS